MASDSVGGALRLRDWAGLICRPVYVHDRGYSVGGIVWEGDGTKLSAAWLVREGRVVVKTGRHKAEARAGEWVVTPGGKHRCEFSDDAAILSVRFHALWPDGRPLIDLEKAVVLGGGRVKALTNRAKQLERFAARSFSPEETDLAWKPAGAVQYLALSRHFYGWLEELVAALGDAGCPPSTPGSWLSRKDGTEAAGVGN